MPSTAIESGMSAAVLDAVEGLPTLQSFSSRLDSLGNHSKVFADIAAQKYLELEIVLTLRLLRLCFVKYKMALLGRKTADFSTDSDSDCGEGQAGWDPIGVGQLAESVRDISQKADRITNTFAEKVDATNVNIANLVSRMDNTFAGFISAVLPEVTKVANAADEVSNNGIGLNLTDFSKLIDMLKDPHVITIGLAMLYLLIEFASRKYEIPYIIELKVLVGAFAVFKCASSLRDLFVGWLTGLRQHNEAQAGFTDWLNVAVQGVAFAVFGATLDTTTLLKAVKSLGDAATTSTKLQDLFTVIVNWFKDLLTLVCDSLGMEAFEWMKPQDATIREFLKEANRLIEIYQDNPMQVTDAYVREVTSLFVKVTQYRATVPLISKNTPVINAIKGISDKLEHLQCIVKDAGRRIGERFDPGFCCTSGAPGVGKTYFQEFQCVELLYGMAINIEDVVDIARNWKRYVYYWPLEPKHHDQYKAEDIVVFPDLFCQTDAEGQASEATFLIYIIGDNPLFLPAAEITKKEKLAFISRLALANTNVIHLHRGMFKSLRNLDALVRRANECGFYMNVNEKYALKSADGNFIIHPDTHRIKGRERDDYLYASLDKEKVPPGPPPQDLWSFRRIDYGKGAFVDNKVYTQSQYIKYCKRYMVEKEARGAEKKRQVENAVLRLAHARIAELTDPGFAQGGDEEVGIDPDFVDPEVLRAPIVDPIEKLIKDKERLDKKDYLLDRKFEAELAREMRERQRLIEEEEAAFELADNGEAQMNNDEMFRFEENHFIPRIPNLVRKDTEERIGDIEDIMNQAADETLEHFREPIGEYIDKGMYDYNVDRIQTRRSRVSFIHNPRSSLGSSVTREQYLRIVEVLDEAITHLHSADTSTKITLPKLIGRSFDKVRADRGVIFLIMLNAYRTLEEDPLTSDLVTSISIKDLFSMPSKTLDEVNAEISGYRFAYICKDPVMIAFHNTIDFLTETYNSIVSSQVVMATTAVLDQCRQRLVNMFFSPQFQLALHGFVYSVGACAGMMVPLILFDWYMDGANKRAKSALKAERKQEKRANDEEIKLRKAEAHSAFTDEASVKNFIDSHIDNFACLYVEIHTIENGKKVKYVRHPCNVTFLGGMVAVGVNHLYKSLVKMQEKIQKIPDAYIDLVLIPFTGGNYERSTESVRLTEVLFEGSEELEAYDLCIMTFKGVRNRTYIGNHIPPVRCLEYLTTQKHIEGTFVRRPVDDKTLVVSGREVREEVYYNFGGKVRYNATFELFGDADVVGYYEYDSMLMKPRGRKFVTVKGDCTSPGLITDMRKNFCVKMDWPQAQNPWICYMHTSLYGGESNGAPLFREMVQPWLDKLINRSSDPVSSINDNIKIYEWAARESGLISDEAHVSDITVMSHIEPMDANHLSVGMMDFTFYEPKKSEIKRSPLFGIDPVTRYPARMGVMKRKSDGEMVDVMLQAREPYGMNAAHLNGPYIDGCISQAMTWFMSSSSVPERRELLSWLQCIYGDAAYNLNSVNWQSSAGFYLRLLKDKYNLKWKAKEWMLNEEQKLHPDVEKFIILLCEKYDEKLLNGERVYSVVIDNIKDELLKKEKVEEGKSRLFCTYDFIYLLLLKKRFGAMAGWIFENRIANGICIGVNPYSDDWTQVADHIHRNSKKCLFLDHAKFDKDQLRRIQKCVLVLADMYYGDAGSANSKARTLLLEEIIQSVHVVMFKGKLFFYTWEQGNTSGNFLTAILNSLVNICYMFIICITAWLINAGVNVRMLDTVPPNPCSESLALCTLGDDVVASINDVKMPGVNFNTIRSTAKEYLNLTITDELKSTGESPDFRNLVDGSFLGRGFKFIVWNGKVRCIAPLRDYSILDRAQWIKGIYDPMIEVEKIESINLELPLKGVDYFSRYAKRYADACFKAYGVYPKYTDFEVALSFVLSIGAYKYEFNDFLFEGSDDNTIMLSKIMKRLADDAGRNAYKYDPGVIGDVSCNVCIEEVKHPDSDVSDKPVSLRKIVQEEFKENCSPLEVEGVAHADSATLYVDDVRTKYNRVMDEMYASFEASLEFLQIVSACYNYESVLFELETINNCLSAYRMCRHDLQQSLMVEAQMDNKTVTDFESEVKLETEATTTFMEAATTVDGTKTRRTLDVSTYVETYADIKSFLNKPVLLTDGQWTTAQTINSNLAQGDISSYLASVAMWQRKIDGFNLMRGDFLIKVQINSSPFQQGKLLLHYLPNLKQLLVMNPGYEKFKSKHLTQKVQHPHVEIDCRTTSITLRIPYVAPTAWYPIKEGFYDWGRWYLDVFAVLRTGAAVGAQTYVDYAVYGWWENVELAAPTVAQSSNKTIRRGGVVKETEENKGPISEGLRKTAKVANVLSEIPVISDFAKPAEWMANIGANLASSLGWSKPRELAGQTNMYPQQLRYAGTCDGPDTAWPGGISSLNRVETIDYASFTNEDEMSLNYLYSVPYYHSVLNWSATTGAGTSLMSQQVGPIDIVQTEADVITGHVVTYEKHVPFTYLAKFHKYWRGGINVTLKFIKTQMHSGRLQVTYVPCSNPTTAPDLTTGSYNKRAIIDIRTEDTVTLTLPYLLFTDYAPTLVNDFEGTSMGQLDIVVLNDLRGPESVADNIDIQVFFSAADDFELAVPSKSLVSPVPYEPQMDGRTLVIESEKQGNVMADVEIGGKNTTEDKMFNCTRCIGEKMFSIKSYLLRNSMITGNTNTTYSFTTTSGVKIDPYFVACSKATATDMQAPDWCGDAFSLLVPMYTYMRGGVKICLYDTVLSHQLLSMVTPAESNTFTTAPHVAITTAMEFAPDISLKGASINNMFEPVNTQLNNLVYQHVPYYNKFPFTIVNYYNGSSSNANNYSKPASSVQVVSSNANFGTNVCLQRSVADDFQLSFFTGCPCLVRSFV